MRRTVISHDEQRFRSLVESVRDWIWEVDAYGVYTYSSPAVEDLLGYRPEEVIGSTPFDFMPPDEAKRVSAEFGKFISQKKPIEHLENINITKDGRLVVLESSGTPIIDNNGHLLGYRGVDRDITERKHAQTALVEAERFLASVFASIQDGVLVLDNELTIIRANSAIETWYPESIPMVGRKCYEALQNRSEICESCPAIESLKTGRPASAEMVRYIQGGKVMRWYELHSFPLLDATTGVQTGVIEYQRDISKRKHAEDELKFRNILLSTQQETSIDGILVVGEDDGILSFNRRFVEMWGISSEVMEAKSGDLTLQSVLNMLKEPERFVDRINYLYKHRTEKSSEEVLLKDGRTFDRYSSPMLGDDGRYYGRIWYYRDITERKALDRQKANFYAMVTHDLKSPLTAILGYAELILENHSGALGPDIRDKIAAIYTSGEKLKGLVDDYLSVTRLESGKLEIHPVPCSIQRILKEACSDLENSIRRKGIDFNVIADDGLPADITIDRGLVQRAVCNLLQNALNYTPAGGTITFGTDRIKNEHGGAVVFFVTDNGPGIPAEDQELVFEKYYRSRTTAVIKGSGLGLAIVKAVAKVHGGRVELESEVGKGSTFRLILPVEAGTA